MFLWRVLHIRDLTQPSLFLPSNRVSGGGYLEFKNTPEGKKKKIKYMDYRHVNLL